MSKKKDTEKDCLIFQPGNRNVPINDSQTVLDVALSNGVELSHSCGGMGSCTTCRVLIESSLEQLSPRTELEAEIASSRNFRDDERLACQLEPHAGLIARIPTNRG